MSFDLATAIRALDRNDLTKLEYALRGLSIHFSVDEGPFNSTIYEVYGKLFGIPPTEGFADAIDDLISQFGENVGADPDQILRDTPSLGYQGLVGTAEIDLGPAPTETPAAEVVETLGSTTAAIETATAPVAEVETPAAADAVVPTSIEAPSETPPITETSVSQ